MKILGKIKTYKIQKKIYIYFFLEQKKKSFIQMSYEKFLKKYLFSNCFFDVFQIYL